MFQDVVYYTGIVTDGGERIIIAFDNNESNVIENDDIDYGEIQRTVEEEIRKEEQEAEREYMEAKREYEEAQNVNLYEESLKERMNIGFGKKEDEDEDSEDKARTERAKRKYGMRTSKSSEEE